MQIEGFESFTLIGRGGFSKVFRAHQIGFDRDVAVKVLEVEVDTDDARSAFRRECELAGRLTGHPNVVPVFDSGFIAGIDEPYIIMEYAPGGSVASRIAEHGHLEVEDALDVAIQVAGALETAHRHGVVHRDVKPQNIVFRRSGAPGLTDFGIAAVAGYAATSASAQAFTPLHAAPELFRGEPASAASDVYGLGSTLYSMLEGNSPFGKLGDLPTTVLGRLLSDPPPPIGAQLVPARLSAVLDSMLAKEPSDRPRLTEVIEELQRISESLGGTRTGAVVLEPGVDDAGRPAVVAPDPDRPSRAASSWQGARISTRSTVAFIAVATLLIIAGVAGARWAASGEAVATGPMTRGAQMISANDTRACAIVSGGRVECWGDNQRGELGDGTTTSSSTPVRVTGLTGVTQISVTSDHACALTAAGELKCWGENDKGELGDGTTQDRHTPVTVTGLPPIRAVATGYWFTCVLTVDGHVQCWGWNENGQLGNGTIVKATTLTPAPVVGLSDVVQLVSRDWASCALLADGTARCWGGNSWGALGDRTRHDSGTPVPVVGLRDAVSLTAGFFHTCATLRDTTVRCWGKNDGGQLGDGTTTDRLSPVQVTGLTGVRQLALGEQHSCALLDTGEVRCWGSGLLGQIANDFNSSTVPVPVRLAGPASQIAAGNFSSCAGTTAVLQCWGRNTNGELGDGTNTQTATPVTTRIR